MLRQSLKASWPLLAKPLLQRIEQKQGAVIHISRNVNAKEPNHKLGFFCRHKLSCSSLSTFSEFQLLNQLRSNALRKCHGRLFHTSQRRTIPPVVWVVVKPLVNLFAAFSGRYVRRQFQALGPKERAKVWAGIRRRWYLPAGAVAALCGSGVVYYYTHLEETPVTGRLRFIAFTYDQILKIAQEESKQLTDAYKDKFYTMKDIEVRRVFDVMTKLINANPEMKKHLPFETWEVYVVKHPLVNACVLPNGHVFVFDGMLKLAQTQDELAIVLGHEMAHAVLSHGVEEISMSTFVDFFVIACLAAIWCILPNDGIALVTHWFYNKVIQLMTHMPHSRKIEKEADKVGLMFAARACYDIRAGSVLWSKMAINEKLSSAVQDGLPLPEWMSTHPDSLKRAEHLDFLFPEAEKWRNSMQCPCLPKDDPRKVVKEAVGIFDDMMVARKAGQDLRRVLHPKIKITAKS